MSLSSRQTDPANKDLATLLAQAPAPSGVGTYADVIGVVHTNDVTLGDPSVAGDYQSKGYAEAANLYEDGYYAFYEILQGIRQARTLDLRLDLSVGRNVISDLIPNGTRDLGSSGSRWTEVWGTALNMSGASTLTGLVTTGAGIVSDTGSTDDLGATGATWNKLWVDSIGGDGADVVFDDGVDMGGNAITNVGNVDGVDISGHAARHTTGAADEIDGDKLDIDWTPSNYTPTTSPSEADSVDNLTAHLAGIDAALATETDDQTLAEVLAQGTVTGANDIEISDGQALLPVTDGNPSIGSASLRFAAGYVNALYLAGATSSDGVSGAADLVIGSGSSCGLTGYMGSGNIFDVVAAEVSGAIRGRLRYAGGSEVWFVACSGADRYGMNATEFYSTAAQKLGTASLPWGEAHANKLVGGVQAVADGATAVTDGSRHVQVNAPSSATTWDLPTAVAGEEFWLELLDGMGGFDVQPDNASDTINGGAGGAAKTLASTGLYHIYAVDATAWRIHGPVTLA